jgi:glycerophosphoryl diester phosphodiesterase
MPSLPKSLLARPIAHRALHDASVGAIENSPAAIDRAIAAGFGIEMDLQLSADGVPMVFHDDTLDRLTDATGPVRARTARDLGALRLTGSQDCIPTLAEVLARVGGAVPLLIELKDQSGCLGESDTALEAATATALKGYAGDVAVMSFNPHMVAAMARFAPDVPRGLTTCAYDPGSWPGLSAQTCDRLARIAAFNEVGAVFISHQWTDLASPHVAALKARGTPILCWTIKTPEADAKARAIADNVTFEGYRPTLDPVRA